MMITRRLLLLLTSFILFGSVAQADGSIKVFPARAELVGPDAVQQLSVEEDHSPQPKDRTGLAAYSSSDESVASVDSQGIVTAKSDGNVVVIVSFKDQKFEVPVTVRLFSPGPPIHFANQVVPIFTKLGCNSGGCHGKSGGQNGFRLSLLGFEPNLDFETLIKEGRGRRLFPAAPDSSLLLTKATAKVPHGGGRRMEPGSHEYNIVRRWIAAGMPQGDSAAPHVDRIEIYPPGRILDRGGEQQLVVTAIYTDGTKEDVTRWTQYQSNDTEVGAVADGGRVTAGQLSGQAAIMARYQGQVAVFRATVPLGKELAKVTDFKPTNAIDQAVLKQWNLLGISPSEPCTDAEFIRRASLDILATLPTAEQVKAFLAESSDDKRARLIDGLLERPEYSAYFAVKWADILRNKRDGNATFQRGTFNFYDWIRENLARNTPYDQFARGILAATGTPEMSPPVMWYRRIRTSEGFVDDTAQVFLGMRLQCAKCHHHPFEVWSQDDYYGFAAFFGRVGRKSFGQVGGNRGRGGEETIFNARTGSVTNPKSGKTMEPKGLGGPVFKVAANHDPRQTLVDWMAEAKNPFFARALVNRYWAHFFGRGVVEPLDDLRVTNPPTNPDLLEALAAEFVKSGYDLKQLVRTICNSQVYSLSSLPNETNATDKQSFARHYPRKISAEVMLDAISQLTAVPTAFEGLPPGTRAIELPDESVTSAFLDTFGRPKRDSACECERVADASLGQSLMMINSVDVQNKLAAPNSKANQLATDPRPEAAKIDELFWSAFARAPLSGDTETAVQHIKAKGEKKVEAYQDIIWALINAKEFQFND